MSRSALLILLADALMMACAIGAMASSLFEFRDVLAKRWRLLPPGVLAAIATAILISYPTYRDLFDLELWSVNSAALLVGIARGALLPMFSDHNYGLVRLRRAIDGILFAAALVVFAAIQTYVEVRAGAENRYEPTMEFLMTVTAGFLFGRSVAAWIRAGMIQHDDLDRPL